MAHKPQAAFNPQNVALQLFVRNTEDLFVFQLHSHSISVSSCVVSEIFFALSSPICISCVVEDFFLLLD